MMRSAWFAVCSSRRSVRRFSPNARPDPCQRLKVVTKERLALGQGAVAKFELTGKRRWSSMDRTKDGRPM